MEDSPAVDAMMMLTWWSRKAAVPSTAAISLQKSDDVISARISAPTRANQQPCGWQRTALETGV